MKNILGLDIGSNSIGWAVVGQENGAKRQIIAIGSRIIPMSQDVLGKFDSGQSVSQTAERTGYRGVRRLRERQLLRRERLHRTLSLMGFLPEHYEANIDRFGKLLPGCEPKIAWKEVEPKHFQFMFQNSFNEMAEEFKSEHPQLFSIGKNGLARKIPYDHTIYYLRKKALEQKIDKHELAWLLLNFNQKRGYYQLRGEDEESENPNKLVQYYALEVVNVTADEPQKGKSDIWYNVELENGWVYRRSSKIPLFDWTGRMKEFIVTTDLNDDGSIKKDKDGVEKRSFRAPKDDDWTLLKKKTEADIDKSGKTVGKYIYEALLKNPSQKINGKLVTVIERKYYKQELIAILEKQKDFHSELRDQALYGECLEALYPNNEPHRNLRRGLGFTKLFVDDIIFYQRPLKSVKSLISNCPYEFYEYKDPKSGERKINHIKCIAKSHPLFQEFRLWQFVKNIKIYQREKFVDGKLVVDADVTSEFLNSEEEYVKLFDWLNDRKDIDQAGLLKSYFKIKSHGPYRWNYVEDKKYPCNETRALLLSKLSKTGTPIDFLNRENELALWHILYSVEDRSEIEKALLSFVDKYDLDVDFVEAFKNTPPFKKEYGACSAKAIRKFLPLMRMGRHWNCEDIDSRTKDRIEKVLSGEYDEQIAERVREKYISFTSIDEFKGLPLWLASYIVYDRHSEAKDLRKWNSPDDIAEFLNKEFAQHSMRNPIVEQIVTETLRVVKDIWSKHGEFSEIHVELGREMKNNAEVRKQITSRISENENTNLRIKALLIELKDDAENVRPYSPSQQEILKIYEDGVLNSGVDIPDDIAKISRSGYPSRSELTRYKCWLEQGYRSPYTGAVIPLAKLFSPNYEIEHIIPQTRYFDDSFSNKVICETAVNKDKGAMLAYEYIKNNSGKKVEIGAGEEVTLFTVDAYEKFVKKHYGNDRSRAKMKKLIMEDIPEDFINRQLNDTRYISKFIKSLLSNIVREEGEAEATSKNVIVTNGAITNELKRHWGLDDVWNRILSPRFERMNDITGGDSFGRNVERDGKRFFQTEVPLELQKGFNKKRIDHRHHAMDALVIACTTRNHVSFLNNEYAAGKNDKKRYDLRHMLCFKDRIEGGDNYTWKFHKPWDTFTQNACKALNDIIVSFKQNLRVINKTVNRYQSYKDKDGSIRIGRNGEPQKGLVTQTKGDSWAIRKPLHKDTVAGLVNIKLIRRVTLTAGIDRWEMLVDKELKRQIKRLFDDGWDKKKIIKFFVEKDNVWQGKEVSKVNVYYFSNDREKLAASRVNIDPTFNLKKIDTVTDSSIRKILKRHLEQKSNDTDLAFSPEGIEDMNRDLLALNGGRPHKPIYKVRTYETLGSKFPVGTRGNKTTKYVEAAKGTNLFFAIYADEQGNRNYETIPFNVVVERLKQKLSPVPEIDEKGNALLFSVSPNDLVYVPTEEEVEVGTLEPKFDISRIYKMMSCSGNQCFFIPHNVATPIVQTTELGSNNKSERAWSGEQIKSVCFKLKVDRLGNIIGISG